ncbi:hypothetical protein FZI91_11355 [Mycobacterium sp. CBMA271]|nr:hypothetical protein [Mycobacteroides sp. CBMA 326]MUM22295.1 hypothetical protein [Mycobacteroides sp. CBMA 271]
MKLRAFGVVAVTVTAALLSGCSPSRPGTDSTDSEFFFSRSYEKYGRDLDDSARDTQQIDRALRRVDPCGFIHADALKSATDKVASYRFGNTLETCLMNQPAPMPNVGLRIDIRTDVDPVWDSSWKDLKVGDVTVKTSSECSYFFPLGLGELESAPQSDKAKEAFSHQYVSISSSPNSDPGCKLTSAAAKMSAESRNQGIPRFDSRSKMWRPLFEQDICSLFQQLNGYSRYYQGEKSPRSCSFYANNAATPTSAALHLTTKKTLNTSWKTENRNGVELYVEPGYSEGDYHDCRISVEMGPPIPPTNIGTANTDAANDSSDWPTPVIEVTGQDCEQNKKLALAAAKKFT